MAALHESSTLSRKEEQTAHLGLQALVEVSEPVHLLLSSQNSTAYEVNPGALIFQEEKLRHKEINEQREKKP